MSDIFSKFPMVTDFRTTMFFVEKEPPKGMDLNPAFGYEGLESDPFPPCMLSDFDPNEIGRAFHVCFSPYNQVSIVPERHVLEKLNHDQRWIIGCNILHALTMFIGEPMSEQLRDRMEMKIVETIAQLARREIKPGVWDETY